MDPDPPPQYVRLEREGPLSFNTKVNQALGAVPDTIKNWVFGTFTLLFYNQVLGLDAFFVSIALAIAIVFDAITDPLVAAFSDNLQTRWGRRHPLMLISALPLGCSLFAVYVPPPGLSELGLFAWLLGFTIATRGLMTLFVVPWSAIAAELSDNYEERTSVMTYRYFVGGAFGVSFPLIVYTFVMPGTEQYPVGQLNPAGYPAMAAAAGLLIALGALGTTLLTRREIPYLRQHAGAPVRFGFAHTGRELLRALQYRQFALIFLIVFLSSAISGTTANIGIYMTTFFWGLTTEDLRWFALAAIGGILAFPLVPLVQKKWDKKQILMSCAVINLSEGILVVNLRFLDVLPDNGDTMLLVILIVSAGFTGGVALIQGIIGSSIVADLLDEHELLTGHRQEAMFNAALSFSGKAVSGVGTLLGGLAISLIQFPTNTDPSDVPPDIILRLGIVVGVALPMLHIIPISLITRYRISRARHAEIREALDARRAAKGEPSAAGDKSAAGGEL